MTKKVAIVDYGLGNLFSVNQACQNVGINSIVTADKKTISEADALILPGVGAFGNAIDNLKKARLLDVIFNFGASGKPFLGICLGMQLLFDESEEFGEHKGFGFIKGKIVRFTNEMNQHEKLKIPQIQWNKIYRKPDASSWEGTVLERTENDEFMYFVHSYYAVPEDESNILSLTKYVNIEYASSVLKSNIVGIQFHPEKSGEKGIEIYRKWSKQINK